MIKNTKIVGIGSIVLATALTFGIYSSTGISRNETVYQLVNDVSSGQEIQKKDIEKIKFNGKVTGAITSENEIVGKYAVTKLYKDEVVIESKIANDDSFKGYEQIDENNNAISITVNSLAKGVSGNIQKGDIVTLFNEQGVILNELKYIEVIDINKDSESNIKTLTFKATPKQASAISQLEKQGNSHLALVCRDNEEKKKELLDIQNKALEVE